MLLGGGTAKAQAHSANGLAYLALDNPENQTEVTRLLVGLLGQHDKDAQRRASDALWRMVEENPETTTTIAAAGDAGGARRAAARRLERRAQVRAVEPLALHLGGLDEDDHDRGRHPAARQRPLLADDPRQGAGRRRARAARALGRRVPDRDRAEGGIAPLIALLDVDMGSEETQVRSAAALSDLALKAENKESILASGGIAPLVALLSDGGTEAKKCAAAALARLSKEDEFTQVAIGEAGAIAPLVNLLSGDRGEAAQEEAAHALWALADHASNRLAITESGGIGPLVVLLGCNNARAREHAEGARSCASRSRTRTASSSSSSS